MAETANGKKFIRIQGYTTRRRHQGSDARPVDTEDRGRTERTAQAQALTDRFAAVVQRQRTRPNDPTERRGSASIPHARSDSTQQCPCD